jgi:dienelactone hydrolase
LRAAFESFSREDPLVCYDADASPPIYGPPITAVTSAEVTLTSADGAHFAGYRSRPAQPSGAGVLVLPDNRGLSAFYERLTVRLAEQGHEALAIDYFGRTAGTGYRERGAEFDDVEQRMVHLGKLTRDALYADFDAGIEQLRATGRAVVSLGFCLGGRFACLTAAARFGLAGAIGLYGFPDPVRGAPGPTQLAHELVAPILAMFGGADDGIPATVVNAFDGALTAAGVPHEIVTYPGAPHGFFEMEQREHLDAQADAWRRILGYLRDRADDLRG